MEFVAIDVETANPNMASICQVGIARFRDGVVVDEWCSLVDPLEYFDPINVSVHGIDEPAVEGAPPFRQLVDRINALIHARVLVSHTHFDRTAISQACNRARVSLTEVRWLDSAQVARRAWKEFARKGYGLSNVSEFLGYDFQHHDALEDAKAAGNILLRAIETTGIDLDGWFTRVRQSIDLEQ